MKWLIVSMILFTVDAAFGQSNELIITGKFKVDGGSNNGAKIVLEKDGRKVKTIDGTSRFEVGLDFQAVYVISFEKEGFVTKKLRFDTHVAEDRLEYGFMPFTFSVEIFEQFDDVNMVVFNQPVGKIAYSDVIDEFDYDTDYTKSIQTRIEEAMDEVEEKKEQIEEQKAAEAEKEEQINDQVNDLTSEAEKNMSSGNPQKAIDQLKEAAELKDSPEIQQKIKEAEKLVAEQEQEKAKEEEFNKVLADAEAALANGDLEGAKKLFEQANGVIEGDSKVKSQLDKIEKELAAQAAKEDEFNNLTSAAEQALNAGNLEEAKSKAEEALKIKPDANAEKILAQAEGKIEEEKAAAAAEAEKQEAFNKLMAEGDELADSKDYKQAIAKLEEAKAINDSPEIQSKIDALKEEMVAQAEAEEKAAADAAKVEKLISEAEAALEQNDIATAKSKAAEANAIDPDAGSELINRIASAEEAEAARVAAEAEAEEEYQKLVAAGEEAAADGKFEEAIASFDEALKLKPDGLEASAGRDNANQSMAQAEAAAAEAEAAEAKKKADFEQLLADADAALAAGNLEEAKSAYSQAGEMFEDKRITKGLGAVEDAFEAKAKEEAEAAEKLGKYTAAVDAGKLAMDAADFEAAISSFEEAKKIDATPEIDELLAQVAQKKEEAAAKLAEEEAKRLEAEELAKAEEEAAAQKLKEEQEAEEARLAEEEAKRLEAEALAKEQEEEAAQKIKEEEEAEKARLKEEEDRAAEEAAALAEQQRQEEDEAAKKLKEEADAEAARLKEEEEKAKLDEAALAEKQKQEEEEAARKLKEEADAEAARLKEEEEAAKAEADALAAQQSEAEAAEKARLKAEEDARKAEELAAKEAEKNAENAAKSAEQQKQEQQKAYDKQVSAADKLFSKNQLQEAKTAYEDAKSIIETPYVNEKLAEIDAKINQAEAAKQKELDEASEADKVALQKEIDGKYAKAISEADAKMASEDFYEAKALYNEAIALKPNEEYPQGQLAEADKRIAEQEAAIAEQKKKEAEQAGKSKERDRLAQIQAEVDKADALYEAGKLQAAKGQYEKALSLGASPNLQSKIDQINDILEKQEEEKRKAKDAAQAIANGPRESNQLANIIEEETGKQSTSKTTQSPEIDVKPTKTAQPAQAVMESDERPTTVKGGAVVISENKVGAAAMKSPSARLTEDDIYDGVQSKVEEEQGQLGREQEQKRLKEKYPVRKTVEVEKEGTSTITYVYINRGEYVNVYKKVVHNWGGVFYFVDERATNQRFWDHETQ